jgi:hypothetical protein
MFSARAEADGRRVAVEHWRIDDGLDELVARGRVVADELEQAVLALDAADLARVLGPVDAPLVVRRRFVAAELVRAVRPDVRAEPCACAVHDREVRRRVDRDVLDHAARLGRGLARLEQIADGEGGTPKPRPVARRPPNVSETASPASLMPSSRPHRQSLMPMTRRPVQAVDATMPSRREAG